MGLFSKKIKNDADMCFIRDLMEVLTVVAKVTNVTVSSELMKQIVKDNHLEQKAYDYLNNYYKVENCYPTDTKEKFRRAQELLKIAKVLELPGMQYSAVINAASACIKKMEFSYNEKIELINTCIVELSGIPSIDEFFISTYINDL